MGHTQRIDWGMTLTCIMTGDDGRDRARAMWDACNEVIEHPEAYHPVGCDPFPPLLDHMSAADISNHAFRGATELNAVGRNVMRAYARYRAHVTEIEARNAARLYMLASTVRTLADLTATAKKPELVHARIRDLERFIEHAWGLPIPLAGDVRTWAQKVTRRYDLLPVSLREV